jgi:hypothetical protein
MSVAHLHEDVSQKKIMLKSLRILTLTVLDFGLQFYKESHFRNDIAIGLKTKIQDEGIHNVEYGIREIHR